MTTITIILVLANVVNFAWAGAKAQQSGMDVVDAITVAALWTVSWPFWVVRWATR